MVNYFDFDLNFMADILKTARLKNSLFSLLLIIAYTKHCQTLFLNLQLFVLIVTYNNATNVSNFFKFSSKSCSENFSNMSIPTLAARSARAQCCGNTRGSRREGMDVKRRVI